MAMDFSKLKDPNFLFAASDVFGKMAQMPLGNVTGVGASMQEYQQQAQAKQQETKTEQWLAQNDPEAHGYYKAGLPMKDAFNYAIQKRQQAQKPAQLPSSAQEFEYARQNGFQGNYMDWISQKNGANSQNELGLAPQYGIDANGNPVIIQLGKNGIAQQAQLPSGVKLSKEPIKFDAGTEYILLDPITRQPVGRVPKDLAGAEAEKTRGKLTGEALQALPATLAKADQAIATIDKALQHPGRETATGASGTFDPRNYFPGTDATNFREVNKQLQGQTFLEAYQSLKGGGQITEVEGAKAEAAIARLSTAQSDTEYKAALIELRQIIMNGKARASQMAGQQPAVTQQADPNVEDLVNKYGN